jgi:glycosyltransferase involved in cell wall biosynthesis
VSKNPTISILLPAFNGEAYLRECIDSVRSQTLASFELLVGDDASTDDTSQIIQSIHDERLQYYHRSKNIGLFRNVNDLISKARAPLVRFLCQDDILMPECLLEEVRFFKTNPSIGMSFCKSIIISNHGCETGRGDLFDLPSVLRPDSTLQLLYYYGCIPGNLSTVCVRLDLLKATGQFNESYQVSGDYELWLRLCSQRPLGVIHEHLVKLRQHEGQLSGARGSGMRFIIENRMIRSDIHRQMPEEVKRYSRCYSLMRHGVLDVHFAFSCLLRHRWKDFRGSVRAMGIREFAVATIFWLATANNRLYRPRAKFSGL